MESTPEPVATPAPEPVPDPTTPPVDYRDLVDVDPATLDPTAEPEAAWWAALGNITITHLGDGQYALQTGV